ncbi:hypothetical protein WDW37_18035, partial [Bdellovibrionota bacterium FG-1]
FIQLAGDRLEGGWVLLGGTLLPYLGIEYRVTTDIDLAGLGTKEQSQTLELMRIAEDLGLPVESINQAAAYFLMKQQPFDHHLILLHRGKKAEIWRPDLFLFLTLKIGRLTESDLTDCLEMVKREGLLSQDETQKIKKLIRNEQKKSIEKEKQTRLERLAQALDKK